MNDNAVRTVMDLLSQLSQPQAEVHILKTIAKCGVESSQLFKNTSTHQHARGRHALEPAGFVARGMIRRKSGVDMARIAVLANHHARMLDRLIRVQQLAPHNGRTRMVDSIM